MLKRFFVNSKNTAKNIYRVYIDDIIYINMYLYDGLSMW